MTPVDPDNPPPWGTLLFPDRYVWFVLFSTLDVMMTFVILSIGGAEANPVANWILERFGISGMTIFKFVVISFVILLCEYVGRLNFEAGRRLTVYGIALTLMPVVFALILLTGS
ncbi:MAG: DUF5658 family protein [Planctomycetota bacterium]